MDTDQEGFWYPVLNRSICLQCEKCADICPIYKKKKQDSEIEKAELVKVYAAWSLNPEIRYQSTSGGIFSELAISILDRGGVICGAVYDEGHMVRHLITDTKQNIGKFRQSKYVQSDMGDIYQEFGNYLRRDKELLFCGTPCQCEGVYRYCRIENIDIQKLYLIDFICRGSNSPKVYQKFLEELEERYQAKITKVWFKNKTYGWNRFSTRIDFNNGACYLQDRYHDAYIRGYIEENLYIRPFCASCGFKGLHRTSDITLADFWGVKLQTYMQESDGGTSMVMVHTKKGKNCGILYQNVYFGQKRRWKKS